MSKFNFDSEFFRRVITKSEKVDKIPSLSQTLREAIGVFYDGFDYYPDVAVYAPGTFTIFGDHLEYVKGNLVQAALPFGTVVVGKSLYCLKCKVITSSKEINCVKKTVFPVTRLKKNPKDFPEWVNFVKGVMDFFPYKDLAAFDAVIHSQVPISTGYGSSAALQVGFYTFLEALICQKSCKAKKGFLCYLAEKDLWLDENKLGSWCNFSSALAEANTCIRINGRTAEFSCLKMRDINILFLLTYPKFDIERKDRDLVKCRRLELYLASKLLGLEEIIDATEEHLNALANMEDPTKETVKEILKEVELNESYINEFIEDLFCFPKMADVKTEDLEYAGESNGEIYGEDQLPSVMFAEPETKRAERCGQLNPKSSTNYIQERIAEMCAGNIGAICLPERVCEKINCLGGIENLSDASGVTVGEKLLRRVRHIITENMRSLSLSDIITNLDYEEFGTKLIHSHLSLKLDYDVSCPTLDGLVQIAIDSERVYGAKMMSGGGTLTLLHRSVVEDFVGKVIEKFGNNFHFYLVLPSSGSRVLDIGDRKTTKSELSTAFLNRDEAFEKAIESFEASYKYLPSHGAYSPTVVNFMGDLTDTYHGFSLSIAININIVVVGAFNGTRAIRVGTTMDVGGESNKVVFLTPETAEVRPGNVKWARVIKGVVSFFKGTVKGFDCVIENSVPLSFDVLSKPALAMAFYTFLEELSGERRISPEKKAYRCMLAIHTFTDTLCGVSEQLVIAKSKENFSVFADSRCIRASLIPFEDPSVYFLITTTDLDIRDQRALFFSRMEDCYKVAAALGKKSLRGVTLKDIDGLKEHKKKKLSEKALRRVKYVITENERALKGTEALKNCDFDALGELLVASHKSLKDDFEAVSDEMDDLIKITLQIDGVFGSKILCSGLFHCMLSLVKHWAVDDLIDYLQRKTSYKFNFYIVNISDACCPVSLKKYLNKISSPQLVFEQLFPV